jgi:hypothetical protein
MLCLFAGFIPAAEPPDTVVMSDGRWLIGEYREADGVVVLKDGKTVPAPTDKIKSVAWGKPRVEVVSLKDTPPMESGVTALPATVKTAELLQPARESDAVRLMKHMEETTKWEETSDPCPSSKAMILWRSEGISRKPETFQVTAKLSDFYPSGYYPEVHYSFILTDSDGKFIYAMADKQIRMASGYSPGELARRASEGETKCIVTLAPSRTTRDTDVVEIIDISKTSSWEWHRTFSGLPPWLAGRWEMVKELKKGAKSWRIFPDRPTIILAGYGGILSEDSDSNVSLMPIYSIITDILDGDKKQTMIFLKGDRALKVRSMKDGRFMLSVDDARFSNYDMLSNGPNVVFTVEKP